MIFGKNKYLKLFSILFLLITLILIINIFINKWEKDKTKTEEPITLNLLANVHPSLPWSFKALNSKVIVKAGDVVTIDYIVENLENIETTGIATFAYFPSEFGDYIRKLNCFCYDAQTLKPKQKDKYSVVLLIDPKVTKDNKTKNIKEVTIQFTFFDYKKYKEKKS